MSARLHIGGHVSAPREVAFADLRAFADQIAESSPLLAGREIGGVPMGALIALARPRSGARSIVAESADGSFMTSLSLESAARCVIVYRVGNVALPAGLGGPFRLFTQGRVRSGDVKRLGSLYVSDRQLVELPESERICARTGDAA